MNMVQFVLLLILQLLYYQYHVYLQKHYKTFQLFVTLVLRGEGVKKETKGINFFIRHRHFDVAPNNEKIK